MAHLGKLLLLPFLRLALWALLLATGCGSTHERATADDSQPGMGRDAAAPGEDGGPQGGDSGPDGGDACLRAEQAFQAFLAAHRDCATDADCTTVGDCGPHIVHEPVNVSYAEEARSLQELTCGTGHDGPTDGTRCTAGQCVRVIDGGECCGCNPEAVNEADYYVRFEDHAGTSIRLSATTLAGTPVELLADEVPSGMERHIFHAVEGTGGHTMPSNFFGTFEARIEGHVLYEGVINGDWVESHVDGMQRHTLTITTERAP